MLLSSECPQSPSRASCGCCWRWSPLLTPCCPQGLQQGPVRPARLSTRGKHSPGDPWVLPTGAASCLQPGHVHPCQVSPCSALFCLMLLFQKMLTLARPYPTACLTAAFCLAWWEAVPRPISSRAGLEHRVSIITDYRPSDGSFSCPICTMHRLSLQAEPQIPALCSLGRCVRPRCRR